MANSTEAFAQVEEFFEDIKEITDLLGLFGDICDPETVLEGIMKSISEMVEDITKVVSEFWSSLGSSNISNILLTIAAMFGLYIGSLLITFIMEGVSELTALINSLIMSVLASIAGIELILQYFMIKFLRNLLNERYNLLYSLRADMQYIGIFLNLMPITEDSTDPDIKNLREAKKLLDTLILNLSIEFVKSTEDLGGETKQIKPIDIYVLAEADSQIKVIYNKLTAGISSVVIEDIRLAAIEAGVSSANIASLIKEPAKLVNKVAMNLKNKYFMSGGNESLGVQMEKLRNILNKINPKIASYIYIIIGMDLLGEYINRISEKVPVLTSRSIKNSKGKAIGSLSTRTLVDSIFSNTREESANYVPYEGKTLKDLNTAITITESAILMFPNIWDVLKKITPSWQADLLRTGIEDLSIISKKMELDISNGTGSITKNFQYAAEISLTQGMYFPNPNGIQLTENYTLNASLSADTSYKVAELLKNLKVVIVNKNMDNGKFIEVTPADNIVLIGKKTLLPLVFLDIAIFLAERARREVLSGIATLNILTDKQIQADSIELSAINTYITNVENIPEFVFVRDTVESFLNLNNNDLTKSMLAGDASGLLRASNMIENLMSPLSIIACMSTGDKTVSFNPIDAVLNLAISSATSLVPPITGAKEKAEAERLKNLTSDLDKEKDKLLNMSNKIEVLSASAEELRELIKETSV